MNSGPIDNLDDDILQAKADLLKAKNIVPPFGKPPARQPIDEPSEPLTQPASFQPAQNEPVILPSMASDDVGITIEPHDDQLGEESAGEFETDPEIEARILANLESFPQSEPVTDSAGEVESIESQQNDQPKSWIEMIKAQAASTAAASADIPKYNLAEQIIAQQRKVASDRRKAPSRPQIKEVPQPAPSSSAVYTPKFQPFIRFNHSSAPSDKVLARIVARDIESYINIS